MTRRSRDRTSAPTHNVGLLSNTYASYVGLRMSDFRATENHAWKVGIDINRRTWSRPKRLPVTIPTARHQRHARATLLLVSSPPQAQAGSQIGIYAEDKWQLSKYVQLNYGLRYDHSTGYTGGWQWSPRVGVNLWDGGKNTFHAYYGRFYAAPLLEDVRQDCVVLQGCSDRTRVRPSARARLLLSKSGSHHEFNRQLHRFDQRFRKDRRQRSRHDAAAEHAAVRRLQQRDRFRQGVEVRLDDRLHNDNSWFFTGTVSGSYAACVSGSTFLFPPEIRRTNRACRNSSPEDHDETVASSAGYTWRFGGGHQWFTTLQGNYGSGFPVEFESANANLDGRLPAHTTFDVAAGRYLTPGRTGEDRGLGVSLIVTNVLNHQYPIKVANGFNTTQIANGRSVLFRLSAPF